MPTKVKTYASTFQDWWQYGDINVKMLVMWNCVAWVWGIVCRLVSAVKSGLIHWIWSCKWTTCLPGVRQEATLTRKATDWTAAHAAWLHPRLILSDYQQVS